MLSCIICQVVFPCSSELNSTTYCCLTNMCLEIALFAIHKDFNMVIDNLQKAVHHLASCFI